MLQDRGLKLLRKQGVEVLLGEVAAKVTEEEVGFNIERKASVRGVQGKNFKNI